MSSYISVSLLKMITFQLNCFCLQVFLFYKKYIRDFIGLIFGLIAMSQSELI